MIKTIKLTSSFILLNILILTIFRIIFYLNFNDIESSINSEILEAFILGFRFDLQFLLIAYLPMLMFSSIKPINILNSKFGYWFWISFIILINLFIILIYLSDMAYFEYFQKRLDSSILRFVYDIKEATNMVIQSYPISYIALFIIIYLSIYLKAIMLILNKIKSEKISNIKFKVRLSLFIIFIFLYILAGYGRVSLYPLRWSNAFFTSNSFASYLACNPIVYFISTLKNKDIEYNKQKVISSHNVMANFLGFRSKDKNKLSLKRVVYSKDNLINHNIKQPNIVFILLESFAYHRLGISKNPLNATPFFDKLSQQGILFTRYYVPHGGTARNIFSSLTGLPDIEQQRSTSRNPLCVKQNIIVDYFNNYDKSYFIGGSTNWGNIRGLLSNINKLNIYEEDYYSSPNNDVWGISDGNLFKEVDKILQNKSTPFFAYVQTSGNHPPYTIPKDTIDFNLTKNIPKQKLQNHGFTNIDQYNAVRLLDNDLRHFFKRVKSKEYFKNTIFVITGDHGLGRKVKHMHKSEESLFSVLHVPLLIYAPNLIKPKKINYTVSSLDLMPTIASLAKLNYTNTTFGRNVLSNDFVNKEHFAFSIVEFDEPQMFYLIGDKFLLKQDSNGDNRRLIDTTSDDLSKDYKNIYPNIAKKMSDISMGIFQSTSYIRYFNKKPSK
jgi:phosphoglycerol transferase MdoB-like AlkP superfamily enzyme